jgi:hypothetical protein
LKFIILFFIFCFLPFLTSLCELFYFSLPFVFARRKPKQSRIINGNQPTGLLRRQSSSQRRGRIFKQINQSSSYLQVVLFRHPVFASCFVAQSPSLRAEGEAIQKIKWIAAPSYGSLAMTKKETASNPVFTNYFTRLPSRLCEPKAKQSRNLKTLNFPDLQKFSH